MAESSSNGGFLSGLLKVIGVLAIAYVAWDLIFRSKNKPFSIKADIAGNCPQGYINLGGQCFVNPFVGANSTVPLFVPADAAGNCPAGYAKAGTTCIAGSALFTNNNFTTPTTPPVTPPIVVVCPDPVGINQGQKGNFNVTMVAYRRDCVYYKANQDNFGNLTGEVVITKAQYDTFA